MFCCDISCLYHCPCFVVISAAACIIVNVLSWYQLLLVSLSMFCRDISCCCIIVHVCCDFGYRLYHCPCRCLYHCPCFVAISAAAWIIVHVLSWYQLPLVSLSMFCCDIGYRLYHCSCHCLYHCSHFFLRYRLLLVSLSMFCCDISCRLYHCPCFVAISATVCIIVHRPLVRSVKLRVTDAPGMSGTSSPPLRVSDPGPHHGTCVAAIWQEDTKFCCDISFCLYQCPCFVVISASACINVHVLLWYQLPLVSVSMFYCDTNFRLYHCPCSVAISATSCITVHGPDP